MRPVIPNSDQAARVRHRPSDDGGWVMVPVMALLAVGLLLCFAALLLVDRQTNASAGERTADAATTLAEGVATATAGVLAGDESNPVWLQRFTGCETVTGDLAGPPAAGTARTLTSAVRAAVNAHFDATTDGSANRRSEYDTRGSRPTTWRVRICPTTDSDAIVDRRWIPGRTTTWAAPGVGTGSIDRRQTLWLIAQGDVRRDSTGGTGARRAVAAKVQRGSTVWQPPRQYALATASYANDLGAVTGQVIGSVTQTVGQDILRGITGTKGLLGRRDDLVADSGTDDDSAQGAIGVRCGLLQGADNLVRNVATAPLDLERLDLNLCLAGSFAGLGGLTGRLGLNGLTTLAGLNLNRFQNLTGYSIAPANVIEAYRQEAQAGDTGGTVGLRTGIYRASIDGSTYDPGSPTTITPCDLPWTQMDDRTTVFVDRIGADGDHTCAIEAERLVNVRLLVINRGRIVVRGRLNGVLYALNGQECANAGPAGCTSEHRAEQPVREVVRIEGGTLGDPARTKVGSVTGTVWTDGLNSRVGLRPAAQPASFGGALGPLLSAAAAPVDNTLCAMPVVGPLVTGLGNLVTGLLTGITGGTQVAALSAGAAGPPDESVTANTCGLVKAAVRSLASVPGLQSLVANGGRIDYRYDKWEKCVPGALNAFCANVGTAWRRTATNLPSDSTVEPGLLTSLLSLGPVTNLRTLLDTLSGDAAPLIVRDTVRIAWATANVADNAAFVPGTFRSMPPEP
jgi:hypothetical protein